MLAKNERLRFCWMTAFSRSLSFSTLYGDIDVYAYSFFAASVLMLRVRAKLFYDIYFYLLLVLFVSFLGVYWSGYNSMNGYFKQALPILIAYPGVFFLVLRLGVREILSAYYDVSVVVACLGLLQGLLGFMGIYVYADEWPRINSIVLESSHLAVLLMPALVYGVEVEGKNRVTNLIIFVALLWTISATGVALLLIYAIIKSSGLGDLRRKKAVPFFFLFVLGSIMLLLVGVLSQYGAQFSKIDEVV